MELTSFNKKIISICGSVYIPIPKNVATYEGITEGDWVKIIIQKIPKPEEKEK